MHDRIDYGLADAREICLALAKVCEFTHQWDGARTLRSAAEYLYSQHSRLIYDLAKQNAVEVSNA